MLGRRACGSSWAGTTRATAQARASQLGIDEVRAEVLQERQARRVEELQKQGRRVALEGRRQDAPALAQATVASRWVMAPMFAMASAAHARPSDLRGNRQRRAAFARDARNTAELFLAVRYNAIGVPARRLYSILHRLVISPIWPAPPDLSSLSVIPTA